MSSGCALNERISLLHWEVVGEEFESVFFPDHTATIEAALSEGSSWRTRHIAINSVTSRTDIRVEKYRYALKHLLSIMMHVEVDDSLHSIFGSTRALRDSSRDTRIGLMRKTQKIEDKVDYDVDDSNGALHDAPAQEATPQSAQLVKVSKHVQGKIDKPLEESHSHQRGPTIVSYNATNPPSHFGQYG
eukprot:293677-Amphidinium_carterae.1